jgi:hypothetical protein
MTTERQSLKPDEMTDRQFLGWNVQTRSQLVEDLYYLCRQNGEILEELLDEYVYELRDNVKRLDELQSYVENEDIIHT